MILKNKYLVNVVDFNGKEIFRKEVYDFDKAMDLYRLKERVFDKDNKSWSYKAVELPNLVFGETGWFYAVNHHELEMIRVNLFGYSVDNEMFRVAAREIMTRENISKGEITK